MTSERWHEIERLYEYAVSLDTIEQAHFVANISDLSLRHELQSLLDTRSAADSFFDRPVLAPRTEPVTPLETGTCIGPYIITGVLGFGGMGEVYKARDQRLEREVALKFLHSHSTMDLSALERMKQEARAVSALNHPRICTLYDLGEHEGRPFLVLELLEGESLEQRLASGALCGSDIIAIGIQMTDALSAAHAKGIVHRDIKPSNIFINARGEIKLLDFGVAKLTTSSRAEVGLTAIDALPEPGLTIPGTACGTAAYMSPEQIRGEPLDARSDLFSVGVTLYKMAIGRLPFRGDTAEEMMEAIAANAPIPPRSIHSAVSWQFEAILLKALEKDRTKRYQRAADLNRDLVRLLSSRSRARSWKVAVASALVLAALSTVAVQSGLFAPAPHLPELTLRQVTANPIEDPVFRGSMSTDGRYAAYSDLAGLHIRRMDTGETRSIRPPEGLCFR